MLLDSILGMLNMFLMHASVTRGEAVPPVPTNYFCGRYGHAATKRGDGIFVYGGRRQGGVANGTVTASDSGLVKLNLSSSWDVFTGGAQLTYVDSLHDVTKPPPLLIGGSIFHDSDDNGEFILYGGGTANMSNTSTSPMSSFPVNQTMWSFSMDNSSWVTGPTEQQKGLEFAPKHGAYVQSDEHGLAFYFNGLIQNATKEHPSLAMTVIDIQTQRTRRVSTAAISSTEARIGPALQYIPELGDKGGLVLIGGDTRQYGNEPNASNVDTMAPLDLIHVLDVGSLDAGDGIWYSQPTNGRVPDPRMDFCAITIPSPDQSGYHIYIVAGRSPARAFDEVWVLSLPQFQWTQVYNGTHPNFGATCHLVGTKQLLLLGGDDQKAREKCEETKITLFDLTNLKWTPNYVKDGAEFRVPKAVYEWIGGTGMGQANMTEPEGGFSSEGLRNMFSGLALTSQKYGMTSCGTAMLGRFSLATSLAVSIFSVLLL
ncbi:hypothetical protein K491DRAFT_691106 [Lophiostoma macrostomum CBS 122681]|uniref:Galactose oxidase n=1 Tax=Lophiostoma macrostomum CBS 122681 TaxID=1314788 RepID=A0A6A6TDB4_9PLEO|nr:hypothetical protein K491DRAFT_691106 [Lophiostoma macrostomum CBS 122681]